MIKVSYKRGMRLIPTGTDVIILPPKRETIFLVCIQGKGKRSVTRVGPNPWETNVIGYCTR